MLTESVDGLRFKCGLRGGCQSWLGIDPEAWVYSEVSFSLLREKEEIKRGPSGYRDLVSSSDPF